MAHAPRDADDDEPPRLRRLRLLVSTLIVVLIVGVLTVVGSLVIKLGQLAPAAEPAGIAAPGLALPAGDAVVAIGEGDGGVLMVTRDKAGAERLLKFDRTTGALLSATPIARQP